MATRPNMRTLQMQDTINRQRAQITMLLAALVGLLRVDDEWHGAVNSEMAGARNAARAAIAAAESK